MSGPAISWVNSIRKAETHSVDARDIIERIRDGQWKKWIAEVRAGKRPKDSLPAVMVSATFTSRDGTNGSVADKLIRHSGLLCADFDKLGDDLEVIRGRLNTSKHLCASFASPSGNGLKAWFYVPPDANLHAGSFRAVEKYMLELTGIQIDQACKDVGRLCFVSDDPEAYYNPNRCELAPLPEPEKPKLTVVANVNLPGRQRIAGELVGAIDWQNAVEGYCVCPGKYLHTQGNGERDCIIYLEGRNGSHEPTIFCFHSSCRPIVEGINYALRSKIGKAEYEQPKQKAQNQKAGQSGPNGEANGKREYKLIDLSTVAAKAVDWIEEPYLARGEMHFLQGQGGSYKGTMTLTWAAEFSRRGEHVLLILAEDDLDKKVLPTLMASGADISFVHPMTIHTDENDDALVLPDDMAILERAVIENKAGLVVIDPLLSHVSGRLDSYRDHDMKRVLTHIGKLAQRTNSVIVCVHHTKKDTSGGMKLAGMGSVAFYTTARVVLTMAKMSEQEVVLEVVKSNLGAEGERQLMRAEIVEVAQGIRVPRLSRAGESPMSAAEAMSGEHKEKRSKAQAGALRMLDILDEEGEQKQSELFDRVAKEVGLTVGTVKRKVYWDILMEQGLVEGRRDGFQGGYLVARTDRDRPSYLTQTVTTAKSHYESGHTMDENTPHTHDILVIVCVFLPMKTHTMTVIFP